MAAAEHHVHSASVSVIYIPKKQLADRITLANYGFFKPKKRQWQHGREGARLRASHNVDSSVATLRPRLFTRRQCRENADNQVLPAWLTRALHAMRWSSGPIINGWALRGCRAVCRHRPVGRASPFQAANRLANEGRSSRHRRKRSSVESAGANHVTTKSRAFTYAPVPVSQIAMSPVHFAVKTINLKMRQINIDSQARFDMPLSHCRVSQ